MKEMTVDSFLCFDLPPVAACDQLSRSCDSVLALPDEYGHGKSFCFSYSENSTLQISDLYFHQDIKLTNGRGPLYGALFVLEGTLSIQIQGIEQQVVPKGHACIFMLGSQTCGCSYSAGHSKIINYTLGSTLMGELAAQYVWGGGNTSCETDKGNEPPKLVRIPINAEIKSLLTQIYQCELPSKSLKLLIQAKMLELMTALFALYEQQKSRFKSIKHGDLLAVYKAAEYLEVNMQNPPSIITLAKVVGINDNKLKKQFKLVYGNTVYGYLARLRINKAAKLLHQTELPVSQIALSVGFKHGGHFAKSFKATFSMSPSEYRKNMNGNR
ncbi:helix-turn-helix transcriptional regulator [Pseudoalteromonas luteoviolacea]|uniref:helix-turn-helix domain-containing protein n=1 Tax=Pseudoalteromonas luteoviolacea TaxID=43657 RepID=UPI001B37A1BA|nr:AraC family transcriptional regulator [Pseudoalteromonas luteoviolacea]MBQ4811398.1 helix-turn-helix transcriptional regulator [Pseudoalteromonas luteoviolacea]